MATNTGIRKCKVCKISFKKASALQYICGPACQSKYNRQRSEGKESKAKAINQYSTTNMCRCSDGTVISSSKLAVMITKAKAKKLATMQDKFGHIFCEDCKEHGVPEGFEGTMEVTLVDCSHDISVDECKKSGRSELAASPGNIRMRCRWHHKAHDKSN